MYACGKERRKKAGFRRLTALLLAMFALLLPVRLPVAQAASQTGTATANVILRQEESTSSKALATIKKGKNVDVLSVGSSWIKVQTGSLTGYVSAKYLELSGSQSSSASSSSLKKGDEGQDVKDLQQALISLGYLHTDATGTFGSATKEAVEAFQKDMELSVDGVAGPKTLTKLYDKTEVVEGDSQSASGSTLKKGDEGSGVTELQNLLKAAGYFSSECTGYFGSITETALKNYQRDKGLTVDGLAGEKTLASLRAQQGGSGSSVELNASGTLRQGDESDQVKALQLKLKEKGYLTTEATGFFGSATYKAVMQFQKEMGLTADGVAGPETLKKLSATNTSSDGGSNSAGQLDTSASLKKGDESDQVKALQLKLIEKGYLTTEATGFFGSATESAVKKFQKDNGLSQDGVAGPSTLKALNATSLEGDTTTSLKKGDESDEVKKLQQALIQKGYLSTEATGFFGSATESAVIAFQKANGLTQDGVAGPSTLKLLYASDSSSDGGDKDDGNADDGDDGQANPPDEPVEPTQTNGNVVLLDWWSGVIDSTFKRGETAEVKDVETGITFTIARYGGSNHLDAEPLTPEDTEKMYKCFNYTWTWSARAIHITINGVTYAAAMNGMPHGGERITSNNFNGQFCIHFLNSRTHGGNQVNQDMQNQIMIAFNAAS